MNVIALDIYLELISDAAPMCGIANDLGFYDRLSGGDYDIDTLGCSRVFWCLIFNASVLEYGADSDKEQVLHIVLVLNHIWRSAVSSSCHEARKHREVVDHLNQERWLVQAS